MVFTMVMVHSVIEFWHNFHPRSTENMDLEAFSHFATSNRGNSGNCTQSGSQEAPQIHPKIDENGYLGLRVSIWCPPGTRIAKMVPQAPKKDPQGLQNDRFK